MTQSAPSFDCFVGVDIAAKDFTAATLLPNPGQKPKSFKNPFPQNAAGFARFINALKEKAIMPVPERQLVVMEATGPYWVALALALYQAGFEVAVVNPAQVHFFAMAQLKKAKNDKLDAQTLAQFAQALTPKCWTPVLATNLIRA